VERIRFPALTPRQLLIVSGLTGGVLVLGLGLLSAFGVVEWSVAVQLALSTAALAGVAVAVLAIRRADGKALRIDQRVKRQEDALAKLSAGVAEVSTRVKDVAQVSQTGVKTVVAALGEDRAELAAQADRLDKHTKALAAHSRELADIKAAVEALQSTVTDRVLRRLQSRAEYDQIEAMVDLRALLQPRAPMPRLRGWAASPDVLRLLVERVAADRPKLIIECGSGASSVWLGYAVERFGGAKVVALEHEERFAGASRDLIAAHGLDSIVEVRHAPLTDWQGFPWYDTAALADLSDAGLVFVDGPPQQTGRHARYPAIPVLLPHCAPDALIVLDDTVRPDEQEIAERWLREFPELSAETYPAEKGAMVFRRSTL
jgi:predicted O-methyltransferase YrrM